MIPRQFFSLIVVLGLLWLFCMLHVAWPRQGGMTPQRTGEPEPLKPRCTRSKEPPPFAGLTHKPPCALCEHEASHPTPPPPMRPDPMPPTNRRPREVNTSRHFCPQATCDYRGWLGLGNLRANGLPTICQPECVTFFAPSALPAHNASGWHHSTYDDAAWPSEYAAVYPQRCVRLAHVVVL